MIESLALRHPKPSVATLTRRASQAALEQGWSVPSSSTVYAIVADVEPQRLTPTMIKLGAVAGQVAHHDEPTHQAGRQLPIPELLRRARPLPPPDHMVIDNLTEEEGAAFLASLEA